MIISLVICLSFLVAAVLAAREAWRACIFDEVILMSISGELKVIAVQDDPGGVQ